MKSELAFVATCDLVALVRGRSLNRGALLDSGIGVGWVPANLALNAFGEIADPNSFGSLGDLRLIPDLETEVVLPGVGQNPSPLHFFLSNQVLPNGTPWENCLRTIAQKAVSDLEKDHGVELIASFEHELVLFGGDFSDGNPFGLDSYRLAEPFGGELFDELERAKLEPENWLAEYGQGQFEITLKPAKAVVAADRAIILREIVRDCARRHGLRATFAPLISSTSVGNGVHLHLSLRKNGNPIMYDPSLPGNLSTAAATAFNGILMHAESILAWSAPSQVSFLRLTPHRWSAGGIAIAVQNREALLRICPTLTLRGKDPSASFNVEFRAADATANPWILIALLARAMNVGLSSGETPESVIDGELEDDDSVRPLPSSLSRAIDAFKSDVIATKWLPSTLIQTHAGIRESESRALDGLNDDEKCRRYTDVY
jgi:glutamine synthetase